MIQLTVPIDSENLGIVAESTALLILFGLLAVGLTALFYILEKKTRFGEIDYWKRQVLIGLSFGLLCIILMNLGADFQIPQFYLERFGLQITHIPTSAQDSAPIIAALVFGSPAGIIAGVIGCAFRLISIPLTSGSIAATASAISTLLAGVAAAACRHFFFNRKKPQMLFGVLIGIFSVAVKMILMAIESDYFSSGSQWTKYFVMRLTAAPIVVATSITIFLALMVVRLIYKHLNKERLEKDERHKDFFHRILIPAIVVFLLLTTLYVNLTGKDAEKQATVSYIAGEIYSISNYIDLLSDSFTKEEMDQMLVDYIAGKNINQNGALILTDSQGVVIAYNYYLLDAVQLNEYIGGDQVVVQKLMEAPRGTMVEMKLYDRHCFYAWTEVKGYNIFCVVDRDEVYYTPAMYTCIVFFSQSIAYIALYFIVYALMRSVKRRVASGLDEIKGSLDYTGSVQISGEDEQEEFDYLTDEIDHTASRLKQYISKAEKSIEQEMEMARQIQKAALSLDFPNKPQYRIFASMDAAREVGGDFYGFYEKEGEGKVYILIADVSGKGTPAALFMMRALSVISSKIDEGVSPDLIMAEANNRLCDHNAQEMFVTAWLGELDLATGRLLYCSAGHNPPIIVQGGKARYLMDKANLVLGGMEGVPYRAYEIMMQPNDRILLYTDGATEMLNIDQELYGEPRLLASAEKYLNEDIETFCKDVKKDVLDYAEGCPQADDLTFLGLDYFGEKS